jgi:hypothetical protein
MVQEKQLIVRLSYEEIEEQAAFIGMVAKQLTQKFMIQLSQLCNKKNYFTHAGILAEMFEWSLEFFDMYYEELQNYSEATDIEEAVIAFGHGKTDSLYAAQHHLDTYFIGRYRNDLKALRV